jgi:hypothetical protein
MNQHILKKPVLDLAAMEREIRRRLQQEKIKLLISHILCFLIATAVIFFVI